MDLSLFDYTFPKELVAQHPPEKREDARMMVVDRKTQAIEHHIFSELPNYLKSGDVLVLNNAQADLVPFEGKLVPALPPYIKRKKVEDFIEEDFQRYRTVYSEAAGSKAAPTAGFHFSHEIIEKIRQIGVTVCFVTLHISYDTYKPIRVQNIQEHPMHGENYEIPEATAAIVKKAKNENRRVFAGGTTTVRALESWKKNDEKLEGSTSLFITPGYHFEVVDSLLTNFHRPRSTVLVMVSAFAGREFIRSAYEEAIEKKYRLFSYGDCMLIL